MNRRTLTIGWNLLVLVAVLTATTFVPDWGSLAGAITALVLNQIGPREQRFELGLRKPKSILATLATGVLGGGALFLFIKLFLQHLCEIITHSQRDLSAFDFTRGHFVAEIPLILRIALVAGFCEEVIFRGTVIRRLEAILPKNRTAEIIILLASASIFGAAHAYQVSAGILLTGLIGLLFGSVYIVTGRLLWPVILMHATYDLLSLTAISSNLDRVLQAWSLNLFSWLP